MNDEPLTTEQLRQIDHHIADRLDGHQEFPGCNFPSVIARLLREKPRHCLDDDFGLVELYIQHNSWPVSAARGPLLDEARAALARIKEATR